MPANLDPQFLKIAPGRAISRLIGYSLFEGRPLTTKGRWWNPVVFANLRLASRWPHRTVEQPVFVLGMGRSGTTLLGQVVAAHPWVGFLNEPKAIWHCIRPDEDIIGSYAPIGTGRLYLDAGDANPAVVQRAHAMLSWYLRMSRSRRVVDKYPELIFRTGFVRAIFPDARFLIAIRSPDRVLPSVAAWSDSHQRDGADWWGARDQKWEVIWREAVEGREGNSDIGALNLGGETDDCVKAAVEWLVTAREGLELARRDPLAMVVRHEDLVHSPRPTVARILEFCGLPSSPRTERYAEAVVRPGSANGRRRGADPSFPGEMDALLAETWREFAGRHDDAPAGPETVTS
jgi:hypothetical protein